MDRHVEAGRGDQLAIIHDSPITHSYRGITYKDLQTRVASLAGALHAKGIEKGDRVIIYMPMVPEAVVAMLACARLGAIHSVVFGGYVALPAYLAARSMGVPIVIHEANASAGVANKVGAKLATKVFAAVPGSGVPAEVVGIPVRASITGLDRAALRAERSPERGDWQESYDLQLDPAQEPLTLLVRGAALPGAAQRCPDTPRRRQVTPPSRGCARRPPGPVRGRCCGREGSTP